MILKTWKHRVAYLFTGKLADSVRHITEKEYQDFKNKVEDLTITLKESESNCSKAKQNLINANAILRNFVKETDAWNDSIEKIIGRPPNYCWETLEAARKHLGMPPKPN